MSSPAFDVVFVRQYEPEDSDLHAAKLANHVRRHVSKRLRGLQIENIRRQPTKLRLLDSLFERFWPEVELVIAKRRVIETDSVPRVDHLRALQRDRLNGRRDRVARHQEQRVRVLLPDRFRQREHAARPPVVP